MSSSVRRRCFQHRKWLYSIAIFATILAALFLPFEALAWGPITHLSFGLSLLDQIGRFAPQFATLLATYPRDFLYGCLAADITVGKRFVAHRSHHCHNWEVGLQVLSGARTERQKSFAHGYLCHLAADTISHNLYVPYQMAASFKTTSLKHLYWEIRYDALASNEVWEIAFNLVRDPAFAAHNALLQKTLKRALFSFKTNKRIFTKLMAIQNRKQWRKTIGYLSRRSRYPLPSEQISEYQSLVLASMLDFFAHFTGSAVMKIDPSGHEALALARLKRKELRELHIHNSVHPDETEALLQEVRRHFISRLPAMITSPLSLSRKREREG